MQLRKKQKDSSLEDKKEAFEKRPDMVALDELAKKVLAVPKSEINRRMSTKKASKVVG
jgi:hypothetical protein